MKKILGLCTVVLCLSFICGGCTFDRGGDSPVSTKESTDDASVADENTGNYVGTEETTDEDTTGAEDSSPQLTADEQAALFKTFVTIGDSLTQGCQGLNVEASRQYYSWPAQLARQMGTEFNQPLIKYPGMLMPNPEDWIKDDDITALTLAKTFLGFKRVDGYEDQDNFAVTAATLDQILDYDPEYFLEDFRPFFSADNEGTPILNDLMGLINPCFFGTLGPERFKRSAVDQALDRSPTFLTVWIGNNDIIFGTIMGNPEFCTGHDFWVSRWEELISRIKATKSIQGVVLINIVDNTEAPTFQPVNNGFNEVVDDSDIPEGSKTLFFLTGSDRINQVLTPDEQKDIQNRIIAMNEVIKQTADDEGWLYIDAYSYLKDGLANGWPLLYADGTESDIVLTGDFAYGGITSLDGMHPTSACYAHVANLYAQEINKFFGSTIPLIDEVEVWKHDSLCQDPVDPRDHKEILESIVTPLFNNIVFPLTQ
jgi:lysophospholipase L1-like esterase